MAAKKKQKAPITPEAVVHRILGRNGAVTSGQVAEATGLSRQAVHRHLRAMVTAGELVVEGAGRAAHYVKHRTRVHLVRRREGLDEAALFAELEAELPAVRALPSLAGRILHNVFTEMVNNAVDHSRAQQVEVDVHLRDDEVVTIVSDDGIGALESVRRALELDSHAEAIAEISKGKTTTDPDNHSGQGLFFSSKAVRAFELESEGLRWLVDNDRNDNAIGRGSDRPGTRVTFTIANDTRLELRALFDAFTTDLEFDRTRTIVRLFAYGTSFVSRSEAKRLVHGLERFREVVLDFGGVDAVGQGFADEVFRVWARAHAGTKLLPVDMNEGVGFMVRRALAERNAPPTSS